MLTQLHRISWVLSLVLGLAAVTAGRAESARQPVEIIRSAIQAAGGRDRLLAILNGPVRIRGTAAYEVCGLKPQVAFELLCHGPERLTLGLSFQAMGSSLAFRLTVDGERGWFRSPSGLEELPATDLAWTREARYQMKVFSLVPLVEETTFTLVPLGELAVEGKPAIGLLVHSPGHRPLALYFDAETFQIVRVLRETMAPLSKLEGVEESVYTDVREFDGVKLPCSTRASFNGSTAMEVKLLALERLDRESPGDFQP